MKYICYSEKDLSSESSQLYSDEAVNKIRTGGTASTHLRIYAPSFDTWIGNDRKVEIILYYIYYTYIIYII